ncbi:thiamine pyrophosphate-binding protein [Thalassospiraceae bacterium LMO-SO8]|mgnify:FL=1|nr:phosphonopyruvate decarboxylase [Magnetovibrio sp.]MCF3628770.1 phosphonopyruvate decarboxylase [Alphaproteobacteria bacterium LMO-S08]UTW50491.1 phosphonopyruvate decarboxylase [bacterium SCSIO 12827]WND75320.1 thiamine pyrophosphate-binding protein [Thalassospiraceae bacterium LMO-SO8]HBT43078.1 phosphonopyruvate decarboxylase [Rhodospirillaceae bacterium]|tara:strand:+ start:2041 stop:2562 length:522 start_codon:yes stop_codon:yes gene_type:complete
MTENYAWAPDIYDVLKDLDVRQVAYVPDAGHARLLKMCEADNAMRCIPLTTEEEGISLSAGAWLGGERAVMLLQSSGVGNCINMISLANTCRFPLLMLVTMRAQWREFNPWQKPMGEGTRPALEAMGVKVTQVDDPDQVGETVRSAGEQAYGWPDMAAVLLHQKLMPVKTFGK